MLLLHGEEEFTLVIVEVDDRAQLARQRLAQKLLPNGMSKSGIKA